MFDPFEGWGHPCEKYHSGKMGKKVCSFYGDVCLLLVAKERFFHTIIPIFCFEKFGGLDQKL